jgi:hypothetical protein
MDSGNWYTSSTTAIIGVDWTFSQTLLVTLALTMMIPGLIRIFDGFRHAIGHWAHERFAVLGRRV